MPLDVQPLSLRRQIVRLGVLLVLLVASLALAQYLSIKRQVPPPVTVNLDAAGFHDPLPQNSNLEGELDARTGKVAGKTREVHILFSESLLTANPSVFLQTFFADLYNVSPQNQRTVRLGDQVWIEQYGDIAPNEFAILRLLEVADRPLVICYSGEAPKTDADTTALNQICTTGIRITASATTHKN